MSRATHPAAAVDYPYSDGRPMAESWVQLRAMLYLLPALMTYFRDRSEVFVGGDMFLYYERGNPAAVVAPDVFVALGAGKGEERPRLSYKLWEEPTGPDFVLEVASRRTWAKDRDEKRVLYATLGVEEYWLYDPTGALYAPRLRGMRLVGDGYRDLAPEVAVPGGRMLHSAVLGLDVRVGRDGGLHMRDPVTGQDLLAHEEAVAAYEAEAEARAAAEAQVAELQAQLRELRGGQAQSGSGRR